MNEVKDGLMGGHDGVCVIGCAVTCAPPAALAPPLLLLLEYAATDSSYFRVNFPFLKSNTRSCLSREVVTKSVPVGLMAIVQGTVLAWRSRAGDNDDQK